MSRQQRAEIAQQTDLIVREGKYRTPAGVEVTIADAVASAVRGTVLLLAEQIPNGEAPAAGPTRIDVTDESTLSAARRLAEAAPDPVACLNFASARKPGGGYRSGAQAQEESLARSSALAACLSAAPEFYTVHNGNGDARYTDRVIYSPGVPVFRDDTGGLLHRPYRVAFLTAAAPNAAAITDPEQLAEVPEILRRRAGTVLAVARRYGHRRLVLGAWGCGVFGNDPATVAGAFGALLGTGGPFAGSFAHVVFAILDDPSGQRVSAFRGAFAT
ncbi:MAG TPA: TIGR02452 family protein [Actinophytocola sp.]|uniref:TIGR02452 family protein n=1 Tax=Actinophytocola sp. TaxID=1872138 RepID=UPI002DDCB375|nr:TIGR02452 family protein [Actinophytocola sp.]HEV2784165.1 TIGR02452 family protein [Actinophytocola sp.]